MYIAFVYIPLFRLLLSCPCSFPVIRWHKCPPAMQSEARSRGALCLLEVVYDCD